MEFEPIALCNRIVIERKSGPDIIETSHLGMDVSVSSVFIKIEHRDAPEVVLVRNVEIAKVIMLSDEFAV